MNKLDKVQELLAAATLLLNEVVAEATYTGLLDIPAPAAEIETTAVSVGVAEAMIAEQEAVAMPLIPEIVVNKVVKATILEELPEAVTPASTEVLANGTSLL